MSNNEISHVFISGGSKGLGGHLYEQLRIQKNMTITVESYIGKVGGKEGVKLDANHPMAGKKLIFDLEVVNVS